MVTDNYLFSTSASNKTLSGSQQWLSHRWAMCLSCLR